MGLKQRLKPLVPPIALPLVRSLVRLGQRPQWQYVSDRWRADDPRSRGWQHPSVVVAQRGRWPDFLAAIRSTKPLGVSHEEVRIESENPTAQSWLLAFAYAVARAAVTRDRLSVLDWGGGLGYYAVVARAVLPEIAFDYTVKELPQVCAAGRDLLPDVHFTSDAEACLARRYDLVFASNSLQFADDWHGLIARLAAAAERWIFLTRLPLVERARSFVVVQRPYWVGYQTEYVSWVFNRDEFLTQAAAHGLQLEREFLTDNNGLTVAGAPERVGERGFLFRGTG